MSIDVASPTQDIRFAEIVGRLLSVTGWPRALLLVPLALVGLGAVCPPTEAAPGYQSDAIRVRLFDRYRPTEMQLSVASGTVLVYADSNSLPSRTITSGSTATIGMTGRDLRVELNKVPIETNNQISFVASDNAATLVLRVTNGLRESESRTYNGEVRFSISADRPAQLLAVNTVDLETYVASVVTSEYGMDDLEGNKAMAVLARTYALRSNGKFGLDYDHVDHSISQVFQGIGKLNATALEAARQTAGQVLEYDGQLVEAVYHAESGGHTADNESVWIGGKPVPYLRGVDDPYANHSPYASWSFSADRDKLLNALAREYGGTVSGLRVKRVNRDRRVRSVEIFRKQGNLEVSGNEFRLLFLRTFGQYSMKSTRFTVRKKGGRYQFDGQGFGHGVGLSQWGAHEMAAEGLDYQSILSFYFTDTKIGMLVDLAVPPAAIAAQAEPLPEEVENVKRQRSRRGRIGW